MNNTIINIKTTDSLNKKYTVTIIDKIYIDPINIYMTENLILFIDTDRITNLVVNIDSVL